VSFIISFKFIVESIGHNIIKKIREENYEEMINERKEIDRRERTQMRK
jgi:hypothetical protein